MSDDPKLHNVSFYVCELCLGGAGGECHAPGCAFWMHDAPEGDALRVLVEHATDLDGGCRTAEGASDA